MVALPKVFAQRILDVSAVLLGINPKQLEDVVAAGPVDNDNVVLRLRGEPVGIAHRRVGPGGGTGPLRQVGVVPAAPSDIDVSLPP